MEPYEILEKIGQQTYKLSLPEEWKIHLVFHISLLKDWRIADLQDDQPVPTDDVPDVEELYYDLERIIQWRKVKRGTKF